MYFEKQQKSLLERTGFSLDVALTVEETNISVVEDDDGTCVVELIVVDVVVVVEGVVEVVISETRVDSDVPLLRRSRNVLFETRRDRND